MKGTLLAVVLVCTTPLASAGQALLYFDSQLGDDIGLGAQRTLASDRATFVVTRNAGQGIRVDVVDAAADPPVAWSLDLAAPGGTPLAAGAYEHAARYGSQGGAQPGLAFSGAGRSCAALGGRFDVLDVAYDPLSGDVLRLAADFEQHCEHLFPALFGSIRYRSAVPAPRLVPGVTVIAAAHVQDARGRIDERRAASGLPPATWTDGLVPRITTIRRTHIEELRQRLNELHAAAGLPHPFPVPAVPPGAVVRASDLNDVLDAASALGRPDALSQLGASVVSIAGRQLLLARRMPDGRLDEPRPYVIRGVTWSPASRTTMTSPADPENADVRRPEFGQWYRTDVPLLRAMRVNTVRLFIDPGFDDALGPIGLAVLDELYRSGIMVIMTVDDGINDLARVQGAVSYYREHPAILMWSLGSEWNINRYFRGGAWSALFAAQRTEVAAQLVKSLDSSHPVVSSYGEIDIQAAGMRLADTVHYVQTVVASADVWSLNLYRGSSFDNAANESVFDQWAAISEKPMFIGEFGIDAFHARCLTNPPSGSVTPGGQVTWNLDLWNDIARNLSAADPTNAALGGTIFEWNDEWWKAGPSSRQDTGGWTSDGFPDWHGTEEYFGVVDIDRTPRPIHAALAAAFDPAYVPPPHTMTFRAISRGANMCGPQANFRRDGHTFYQRSGGGGGGRGFNVALIDPATGAIVDPGRNFDTWGGGAAAKQALIDHLAAVPAGRLILLAVADEAGVTPAFSCTKNTDAVTVSLLQVLQSLGSTRIGEYCWRGSWAMATIKGDSTALAEDYARTEEARAEPALSVVE